MNIEGIASVQIIQIKLMNSTSTNANWEMALDLLVARASLDNDLRLKLLSDPQNNCHAHGINLP